MLKALYDYACRHQLTLSAGCVRKMVKAWIHLDAEGRFQLLEPMDNQEVIAPDIGSLANSKDKSNILVEKRSVVVPEEDTPKSRFFREALREGSEEVPVLAACAYALETPETVLAIREALDGAKIKPSDRISFKVDGASILELPELMNWWSRWRKQFKQTDRKGRTICLITGEPTMPMTTTTPINGLHVVGGHARGDALICFDKNAFCSYGLKKAENAPVSEEAFSAVKAALDKLLEDAPVVAGMKFVHWYDRELSDEEDPIKAEPDFGWNLFGEDPEEEPDEEEMLEREISARRQADALVNSVRTGKQAADFGKTHYYILLLSGVGGRIMIRRHERGSYHQLQSNIKQWKQDLALTNPYGTGEVRTCKLTARMIRLLKYQKGDRKPFERLGKELSGIAPAVVTAILTGGPLPDSVAVRALASIRSEMMDEEEESRNLPYAYQWLKVWLLRRNRRKGEVELMSKYNLELNQPAYHFGGMMAVYAAIQERAMPDVNVNVVQRYYASAMQTPALVLGQLSHRSVHHLEKMENRPLAKIFEGYLQQLSVAAGANIPATLTLQEQSYFALGYYQMGAYMSHVAIEKAVAKNHSNNTEMEGKTWQSKTVMN